VKFLVVLIATNCFDLRFKSPNCNVLGDFLFYFKKVLDKYFKSITFESLLKVGA
jgi:hypothetical protein